MTEDRLGRLLADDEDSLCPIAVGNPPWRFDVVSAETLRRTRAEMVGYAIRLDVGFVPRLLALLAFRWTVRNASNWLTASGWPVIHVLGVDPSLNSPTCFYELHTPAALYAGRCLRPRGRGQHLRFVMAMVMGVDPAIGAVVLVGRRA